MTKNLCKQVLSAGGSLHPLIIDGNQTGGTGLMNPSVFNDNGRLLVNVRKINYTLLHSEGEQRFPHRYGPLIYTNPENDLHLKTTNYLCTLDEMLQITDVALINTSRCDSPTPLWDFHGLEDIRLVKWYGNFYGCGVRRDTTHNGEGRMEMSYLHINTPTEVVEMGRTRIEPPVPGYCEKNWMPVLDMPYHFIKWSNPTQVVEAHTAKAQVDEKRMPVNGDVLICKSRDVFLALDTVPGMPDFRGGSQAVPWGDFRIACVHEVALYHNRLGQKDGTYQHRFLVWDKDWNLVFVSDAFSFLTAKIEFCCGLCFYSGDMLISFGFQDNAAYILRVPKQFISSIIGFNPFEYKIENKRIFDWGPLPDFPRFMYDVKQEVYERKGYEVFFKVKEGDIVVDVGASVGLFPESIKETKYSQLWCLEPDPASFTALQHNCAGDKRIHCLPVGISDKTEDREFNRLFDPKTPGGWGIGKAAGIRFDDFIAMSKIDHIDFLKCDCEGGEYDIFTAENFDWIRKNVYKIAAEFHLADPDPAKTPEVKKKFTQFIETYLAVLPPANYKITTYEGEDITSSLWTEGFVAGYNYFMVFIDNTL